MHSLAIALLQETSTSQDHINQNLAAGMGVGVVLFFVIFVLAMLAFLIYLLWRIFTKAGMSGALSLLIFVPGIGSLIVLCILAFGDWKVVPIATQQTYPPLPPAYPPPPAMDPPIYPPQTPTV